MTLFGIDVSHYQGDLDLALAQKQGYEFVTAKCTDGAGFADPAYAHFKAQAAANGSLFAAYHFLRSGDAVTAQADNLAAHIGDKSIPVWVDVEVAGTSKPTLQHAAAFRGACVKRGLHVAGLYYPHFWWADTGCPSLDGWALWQAIYGSNTAGHGAAIYPGDTSPRWNRQGGVNPTLLQFGSRGVVDGYKRAVDVDAFRGTRTELAATGLFKDYHPVQKPPSYPHIVKALASNAQHATDLRAINRRLGGPVDLAVRAALAALALEARALRRRLGK